MLSARSHWIKKQKRLFNRKQRENRSHHRLAISRGPTRGKMMHKKIMRRRKNRKLHRTRNFIHKNPHQKIRRKHKVHKKQRGYEHRQFKKRRKLNSHLSKKNQAEIAEKSLVRGVDNLIRENKKNQMEMYNNWKMYLGRHGGQFGLI